MARSSKIVGVIVIVSLFVNALVWQFLPAPALQKPLTWNFEWDENGRLAKVVNPAGKPASFQYKTDDKKKVRQVVKEQDGAQVVFDYDEFGRRTRRRDDAGTVEFGYDGFDRLTEVRHEGGPTLRYSYDSLGRPATLTLGTEYTVKYAYDFLGRLEKIDTPAGSITYQDRRGSGSMTRTLPNGIRSIWKYGPGARLDSLTHEGPANVTLVRYEYAYRPDGLLREVKEKTLKGEKTTTYEYDQVQRLVAVSDDQGRTIRYDYDLLGNRTEMEEPGKDKKISSFDWAGRLTKHNGYECRHDEAGNLISYVGTLGKTTLAYTPANLLKEVLPENGSKIGYVHDGDGNLVARQVGGQKTTFISNPQSAIWQPLLSNGPNGKRVYYIWEGTTPLAQVVDGQVQFFLHDYRGSVNFVADSQGKITGSIEHCPFGVPQGGQDHGLRPGFVGLFYDPQAGLYLTQARAYDPTLGAFSQRDPQRRVPRGSQQDLSAYVYCGNDPVNFVDRDGAEGAFVELLPPSAFRPPPEPWTEPYPGPPLLPPAPVLEADPGMKASFDLLKDAIKTKKRLEGMEREYRRLATPPSPDRPGPELSAAPPDAGSYEIVGEPEPVIEDVDIFAVRRDRYRLRNGGSMIVPVLRSDPRPIEYVPPSPAPAPSPSPAPTPLPRMPGGSLPMEDPSRWRAPIGSAPPAASPSPLIGATWEARYSYDDSRKKTDAGTLVVKDTPKPPTPIKVGGVALRGAGKGLEGLGLLTGIAVDGNGRLVLIAQESGEIALPPLRLDDLVTVFRCVYEEGDAPSVSIDPDAKDPLGPLQHVRHGPGTANTYVGWVLFEADRIMKTYFTGKDNLTGTRIRSTIEGYRNLSELRILYNEPFGDSSQWDRFWIVPETVNRLQTKTGQLTLFDVPLKVRTEASIVRNGRYVADPDRKSGKAALAFADWFTRHYEDFSRQARSRPPDGSGIEEEVLVFAELRRIALMVSIAERLRDQGVPMPGWMHDYRVRPCPVPETTPALTNKIEQANGSWRSSFGGVTLAPPRSAIRIQSGHAGAEALAPAVERALAETSILTPVKFTSRGKRYQAVALPGDDTQDLGALELTASDLRVPLDGARPLSLIRSLNSFFQPGQELGSAWTLDLPRLRKQKLVTERTEKGSRFRHVFQMTSPLETWNESFVARKFVPELEGEWQVPRTSRAYLGLGTMADGETLLHLRDGRKWYFNPEGQLIREKDGALTVTYKWDDKKRLSRIESKVGQDKAATISLQYDGGDRLASARGSNGQEVRYSYDGKGFLTKVKQPVREWSYEYANQRVVKILRDGKEHRKFDYDFRGRLHREWHEGVGDWLAYTVKPGPGGQRIAALQNGKETLTTIRYDAALRPVEEKFADGTLRTWRHDKDGAVRLTQKDADGGAWEINKSAGGASKITRKLAAGGQIKADQDAAGRLIVLSIGERPVLSQKWHSDGLLESWSSAGATFLPRYDPERRPEGFFVGGGSKKGNAYSHWLEARWDKSRRSVEIKDHTGGQVKVALEKDGQLAGWTSPRGNGQIQRSKEGRIEKVQTSWGLQLNSTFDPKGEAVQAVELKSGDARAALQFSQGRLTAARHFDGGELTVAYYAEGPGKNRLREIRTAKGLTLKYEYNADGRIAAVDCGTYRLSYTYDGKGRLKSLEESPGD